MDCGVQAIIAAQSVRPSHILPEYLIPIEVNASGDAPVNKFHQDLARCPRIVRPPHRSHSPGGNMQLLLRSLEPARLKAVSVPAITPQFRGSINQPGPGKPLPVTANQSILTVADARVMVVKIVGMEARIRICHLVS